MGQRTVEDLMNSTMVPTTNVGGVALFWLGCWLRTQTKYWFVGFDCFAFCFGCTPKANNCFLGFGYWFEGSNSQSKTIVLWSWFFGSTDPKPKSNNSTLVLVLGFVGTKTEGRITALWFWFPGSIQPTPNPETVLWFWLRVHGTPNQNHTIILIPVFGYMDHEPQPKYRTLVARNQNQ